MDNTDSEEDEVFFGPIGTKEIHLLPRFAKRKTEIYSPNFRDSFLKTDNNSCNLSTILDENFDVAAEEVVESISEKLNEAEISVEKGSIKEHEKFVDTPLNSFSQNYQKKFFSPIICSKKKNEPRISSCYNVVKRNYRLSPADNQKVFLQQQKDKTVPSSLKIKPKVLSTKTPETLLKSTLKKNHRIAVANSRAFRRSASSNSSLDEESFQKKPLSSLKSKENEQKLPENEQKITKPDVIWTNFSSSEENGSSCSSSDDGELITDVNTAITRTVEKYTPKRYTVVDKHKCRQIFS